MKKILVTGSNGLLGQKITEHVLKNGGFELIATAKGENRYPVKTGYHYVEMDILNPEQVREVMKAHQPDAVIHTAAMTNVDACEAHKEEAFALNVEAVIHLAQLCEAQDVQLIHLSTDFIFDGEDGPYREDAAPNPLSYYGETKLLAEEAVKQSKGRWAILRTIIVYGVVADMSRSNIVLWAKDALKKGQPLSIVNDQWRMPTLAEDLAACCLLAVSHDAQGIYNVSGKDMMSIVELVRRVADFWGLDKSLIQEISAASLNQTAKRPKRTGFILDKAMTELHYQPHSFEEGLQLIKEQLNSKK